MENGILTTGDVAKMYNVAPKTVTRWAKEGLLPYFRTPGGNTRFRREEIEVLIEAGTRPRIDA